MAIITEQEIIALPVTEQGKWTDTSGVKFGTHGTGADQVRWAVLKRQDGISKLIECYLFGLSKASIDDWMSKVQKYIGSKGTSTTFGASDHRQDFGCVVRCRWRIPN